MLDPSKYSPDRSLPAKIKRRLTYWRPAKPMAHTPKRGIVSFTFDDFPKSAAQYGADALVSADVRGTYYVCTGMRGHMNIMGQMYDAPDLETLALAGHEIGAHTHSHLDCSRVSAATVRGEIEQNLGDLKTLGQTQPIRHFAWPYGETTLDNKRKITDQVATARGILPGINSKGSDLMQLGAFELTPDAWTTMRAIKAIERTARKGGWTIIFTHDVQANPSPFGTTGEVLKRLVKASKDAGLDVLPVADAYAQIQVEGAAA